jgi:hypothetical protein
MFVRLALKVVMQNDGEIVDVNLLHVPYFKKLSLDQGDLGSSVGKTTGYGLDGTGFESQWERDFLHLSRPALGPTQPPIQGVPCLSRE